MSKKPMTTTQRSALYPLLSKLDFSWLTQLSPELQPQATNNNLQQNRKMRPVYNGHYVLVPPTPLKKPRLVAYSQDMANLLQLSKEQIETEDFVKFFSGNVEHTDTQTWATPYALSIMGTRYTSNCPFGTGNGYGDGRAISIAEVLLPNKETNNNSDNIESNKSTNEDNGSRWEFQLKGAGPTPFCRGADGRAVLRSSIREFLASEAMHHLNISTTRALSLIVSEGGDTSQRPWYSLDSSSSPRNLPDLDDPRLANYTLDQRKQIIAQLKRQKRDPDTMIVEPNAITCRVSPSFTRVGHVDLFARRAAATLGEDGKFDHSSNEYKELREIIWHAAFREYYHEAYLPFIEDDDIEGCVKTILKHSAENIAELVAGWVRVGFAQGNFNADNCLVAGRTMDYGPFGFMDEYSPVFAKWTGSGEHFGFLNQPSAGYVNYVVLAESMIQVIKESEKSMDKELDEILEKSQTVFQHKMNSVWRAKLGFHPDDKHSAAGTLWQELEPIIRANRTDWTLFWRQLYEVVKAFPITGDVGSDSERDYEAMFEILNGKEEDVVGSSPFYERLTAEESEEIISWLKKWRKELQKSYSDENFVSAVVAADGSVESRYRLSPDERMRLANPKYVLREWMLVEAYTKASNGDESMIHDLLDLIKNPYDEGTEEHATKYYRRAPDEALSAGGTAFMS